MVKHAYGELTRSGVARDEIRYEEFIAAGISDESGTEHTGTGDVE
jgi:hypothetical protein